MSMGPVHIKRIEGRLRSSLKLGVLDFERVATKLEDKGIYAPLLKVGQTIYYITIKDGKYVLDHQVVSEIKITSSGFRYIYHDKIGDPHEFTDQSVGANFYGDLEVATKILDIMNSVQVQ